MIETLELKHSHWSVVSKRTEIKDSGSLPTYLVKWINRSLTISSSWRYWGQNIKENRSKRKNYKFWKECVTRKGGNLKNIGYNQQIFNFWMLLKEWIPKNNIMTEEAWPGSKQLTYQSWQSERISSKDYAICRISRSDHWLRTTTES